MILQFLLFVIAVLLVAIFWELTKINKHFKSFAAQGSRSRDWEKKAA